MPQLLHPRSIPDAISYALVPRPSSLANERGPVLDLIHFACMSSQLLEYSVAFVDDDIEFPQSFLEGGVGNGRFPLVLRIQLSAGGVAAAQRGDMCGSSVGASSTEAKSAGVRR